MFPVVPLSRTFNKRKQHEHLIRAARLRRYRTGRLWADRYRTSAAVADSYPTSIVITDAYRTPTATVVIEATITPVVPVSGPVDVVGHAATCITNDYTVPAVIGPTPVRVRVECPIMPFAPPPIYFAVDAQVFQNGRPISGVAQSSTRLLPRIAP